MPAKGFKWEGYQHGRRVRVECTSDTPEYKQCTCKRCTEIGSVSCEEEAFRVGEYARRMIREAWSDLFLFEGNEDKSDDGQEKKVDPVLPKLAAMSVARRHEAICEMQSAYEWFMSDLRELFFVTEEGEVEAAFPYLVACEAARIDPSWWRQRVTKTLNQCGITPDMLVEMPDVVKNAVKRCDDAKAILTIDPVVQEETIVIEAVIVQAPTVPVLEVVNPVVDPARQRDTRAKVAGWFKALKKGN